MITFANLNANSPTNIMDINYGLMQIKLDKQHKINTLDYS